MHRFTSTTLPQKSETWVEEEFKENPLLTWRWAIFDIAVLGVIVICSLAKLA